MKIRLLGIATLITGLLVITGCYGPSKPSESSLQPPSETKATPEQTAPPTAPAPAQQEAAAQPAAPEASTDSKAEAGAQAPPTSSTAAAPPAEKDADPKTSEEEPKKANESPASTGNNEASTSEGNQAQQPAQPEDKQEDKPAITVETVKSKYNAELLQLKNYYVGKLQAQLNQAVAAKQSGQSNTDIFNNYSQQAGALQEESQAKLNGLLVQMKNELLEQQLPTDSVNEFRTAFYAEVDKMKASFMQQARSQFAK